jgi:hypothetical protein
MGLLCGGSYQKATARSNVAATSFLSYAKVAQRDIAGGQEEEWRLSVGLDCGVREHCEGSMASVLAPSQILAMS